MSLHFFCVAILSGAFSGATSQSLDHTSVDIRSHAPVIEQSTQRIGKSRAWLFDLAAKKLNSDTALALLEKPVRKKAVHPRLLMHDATGKHVANLVRSEQASEEPGLMTGVGDAYEILQGIANGKTQSTAVTLLRITSIGFLVFLFGFVVHFTTQRFSKIRNHENSFVVASANQTQKRAQSKLLATMSKNEAAINAEQLERIAARRDSEPEVPPVLARPSNAKDDLTAHAKMQGVPKARPVARQAHSIKSVGKKLVEALGFSDSDMKPGRIESKKPPKPKAKKVSRRPPTATETQSESSSEASSSDSSEATSHQEQQHTSASPTRKTETVLASPPLSCYPWHTLPTPEMLLSVGPTFHFNLKNALPDLLAKRGLHKARPGKIALVSLWNWPGQRQRALAELCLRDTLANKRAFAGHLARCGLQGIAPLTFLNPMDLRRALKPNQRQPMPKKIQEGLWFLKHAGRDNNLGVTCFRSVHALLNHWEGKGPGGVQASERLQYVAQFEVQKPLLFTAMPGQTDLSTNSPEFATSQKVTTRAYVLILGTGRCFLHRELLLKAHPLAYDANDPDPLRHVLCHSKYDGVMSGRGTAWEHYGIVWPKISDMMGKCFRSFDFEALQDEAILDDGVSTLYRAWSKVCQCMATIPLLQSCMRRRRRGIEEADSMKYALLGLDVIVDENLRPWCLELNRSPTLNREDRDPTGSQIKDEVVEDFCELLIDPLLRAAAKAASNRPPNGPWGKLQQWASEDVSPGSHALSRGFVEIS